MHRDFSGESEDVQEEKKEAEESLLDEGGDGQMTDEDLESLLEKDIPEVSEEELLVVREKIAKRDAQHPEN